MESSTELFSNGTVIAPLMRHPRLLDVAHVLKTYVPFVVTFLGIPGNLLNFWVMLQQEFRSTTGSVFMRLLAITDITYIIVRCLQRAILAVWRKDWFNPLDPEGNFFYPLCIEYAFFLRLSGSYSRWLLVSMAIDRTVAMLAPLRARTLCTVRNAVLLSLFFFLPSIIEGGTAFFNVYREVFSVFICPYHLPGNYGHLFNRSVGAVVSGVCVFLLLSNVVIIISLYRNTRLRSAMQGSKDNTDQSKNRQITFTLLGVALAYVITSGPREVYLNFISSNPNFGKQYPDLHRLFFEVLAMEHINYSVNFYVFLACSSKFRAVLRRKLRLPTDGPRGKAKQPKNASAITESTEGE